MQILDRVLSNVKICGIEVSFSDTLTPSIIQGWQPFYNSQYKGLSFYKNYASLASIQFQEESSLTNAGYSYKQKIAFRFPEGDAYRSERLALLQKIKLIKLKRTDGTDVIIGRNDFYQNTAPIIKIETNAQKCEVKIEAQSIMPSGFSPSNTVGLPTLIPFFI